jgi:hypothetical protein
MVSFAQERIFLDQKLRFTDRSPNQTHIAPYNELAVLKIAKNMVPLSRLQRAIQSILTKHLALRTSVDFHSDQSMLIQRITNRNETFDFAPDHIFDNYNDLQAFVKQIIKDPTLFDLTTGRVFYVQPIRRRVPGRDQNDEFLMEGEVLLIAFHHIAFDRTSRQIFFKDLSTAYSTDSSLPIDQNSLQYIDYSVHERQLEMTTSSHFWQTQLHQYDFEHELQLPFDRHRSSTTPRSGKSIVVDFTFSQQLSQSFLTSASSHNITPFQLGLAAFYILLFKLTNGQQDLCVGCVNANRYRSELQDMIGMFVATLPYRLQFTPHLTFEEFVEQVRNLCLSILEHSHYPLQHIINHHHSPAFLEVMYDYVNIPANVQQLSLGETTLESMSLEKEDFVAKFDLMLTLTQNSSNEMSCSLICSQDRFDQSTVQTFMDRFSHLLHQLFDSSSISIPTEKPLLYQLSVILPEEQVIIDSLKNNDIDRPPRTESVIHELFIEQVLDHPQKVSVELDEQMITYSELLFYSQQLALVLLQTYDIKEGEIICQYVERSLSMVRLFE